MTKGILKAMNDITSLQQTLSDNLTSSVTTNVQSDLTKLMGWVLIPSIILTFIVLIVYVAHLVHRHKVDKAIFEIRDAIREMKLAQVAPAKPAFPTEVAPPAPLQTPVATVTNETEVSQPVEHL